MEKIVSFQPLQNKKSNQKDFFGKGGGDKYFI